MGGKYIEEIKKHPFFLNISEIDENELLVNRGLNSIETIDLILFLEEHFKISIPLEDITFDKFSTLKKISNYIESLIIEDEVGDRNKS